MLKKSGYLCLLLVLCVLVLCGQSALAETLRITRQPCDVMVPKGQTAQVSVAAEGVGLKYRWYYAGRNDTAFSKSSITAPVYEVEMNNFRNGRRVYCVVTDADGQKVTSEMATLSMAPALKITKQPESVTAVKGQTAQVSVAAEGIGLKYRWYYAGKNDTAFSKSSITAPVYEVEMNNFRNGRRVYCVVTDAAGQKVTSEIATLSMAPALKITKQPVSVSVGKGRTAQVSVSAKGEGLKYQWYYANEGKTRFAKATVTTKTYAVTMNTTRDGRRIYCVITDAWGQRVTTDTVTLSMLPPPRITRQPVSVKAPDGQPVQVSVAAEGDGLKYQWYYANKGKTRFSKASITGATYTVDMNATRNGRRVYCIVTDVYGRKTKTDTVILSMAPPLVIAQLPDEVTVAGGQTAKVTVEATGDGLRYQWYYANDGDFSKSSITEATYAVTMNAARNGRLIYCVVTDAYGQMAQTQFVRLNMAEPLSVVRQATDYAGFEYTPVCVDYAVWGQGVEYQWYYANKGKTSFKKSSITDSQYRVDEMTPDLDGRRVYCIATDQYGQQLRSETVTLRLVPDESQVPGLMYDVFDSRFICITGYIDDDPSIVLPDNIAGVPVTRIEYGAFQNNTILTSVTVAGSIEEICTDAFAGCTNLRTVKLKSGVASIGARAFDGCKSLTSLTLSAGLTTIEQMAFNGCSSLKSVVIPDGTVSIGDDAFSGCLSLSSVTMPGSVTTLGSGVFSRCTSLTAITLPDSITDMGTGLFSNCAALTDVTLPSGLTCLPGSTFWNCHGLKSVRLPETCAEIGYTAFAQCTGLTTSPLHDGITVLGTGAFQGCTSLTEMVLPEGVKRLDTKTFEGCTALKSIRFPADMTYIGLGNFTDCTSMRIMWVKRNSYAHQWCVNNKYDNRLKFY